MSMLTPDESDISPRAEGHTSIPETVFNEQSQRLTPESTPMEIETIAEALETLYVETRSSGAHVAVESDNEDVEAEQVDTQGMRHGKVLDFFDLDELDELDEDGLYPYQRLEENFERQLLDDGT